LFLTLKRYFIHTNNLHLHYITYYEKYLINFRKRNVTCIGKLSVRSWQLVASLSPESESWNFTSEVVFVEMCISRFVRRYCTKICEQYGVRTRKWIYSRLRACLFAALYGPW